MSEGLYHFPLYYQRLLTSTVGWTDEEFGAYMRLLIFQFDNGYIPVSKKEIVKIAPSAKKNWKILSKKFSETDGKLANKVMKKIREESISKCIKNRKSGKLGGRPKKQTVIPEKPNGFIEKPNGFENKSQPRTNNQEPIEKEKIKKEKNGNIIPFSKEYVLELMANFTHSLPEPTAERIADNIVKASEEKRIGNPQSYVNKVVNNFLEEQQQGKKMVY